MILSPHFTLAELTVTSTGLPNVPSPAHVEALRALCLQALEPWRAVVGPIRITSGYRSPEVNAAIRGSKTSQHMRGEAADCQPLRGSLVDAWEALCSLLRCGLPVDQAILYVRPSGQGWIHVSHDEIPRRQLLVERGGRYVPLEDYEGPLVLP